MVGRAAAIQIVALTVILADAAWQPVRAEDTATQHASNGATCARSTFRVLIDVGHTATSPGADSARGVPEYVFNLKLADVIAQSLHDAGFDETVRLITSRAKLHQSVRACGAGQPYARRPVHRRTSRFGDG